MKNRAIKGILTTHVQSMEKGMMRKDDIVVRLTHIGKLPNSMCHCRIDYSPPPFMYRVRYEAGEVPEIFGWAVSKDGDPYSDFRCTFLDEGISAT